MVDMGVLCVSVVKASIVLIMEIYMRSPHPCMMDMLPMFARSAITGIRFPNEAGVCLFLSLAQSPPLSCMQICHVISLLHLCAKPISIPLHT